MKLDFNWMEPKLSEANTKDQELNILEFKPKEVQEDKELLNKRLALLVQFNNMEEWTHLISRWFNLHIEEDNKKTQVEDQLTVLPKNLIEWVALGIQVALGNKIKEQLMEKLKKKKELNQDILDQELLLLA